MTGVRVDGAKRFTALAKRLKAYNDKALRSEFYKGISRAAKPLIADVRASFRDRLPKRGGLAERVAKSKISAKRRMSGRSAGVRIVGTNNYDLGSINRGRVRHLVYGHKPWINQKVQSNTWTDPLEAGAPVVEAQLEQVMYDVARKIQG
jgi:hypothetical protein